MPNLINNKIDQLPVKAKIMSKWYNWDSLKELVTADIIQQGTLCKLLSTIEDRTIYEYDCYFRFRFKENQIGYLQFYYQKNGSLKIKSYSVFNYGTHLKIQLDFSGGVLGDIDNNHVIKDYTFIGNWHDGQKYLSNQIEKLMQKNERN